MLVWLFYQKFVPGKRWVLHTKNEQKKSKEVKKQRKRLKATRKSQIDRNKNIRLFYMNLVIFIQCRVYFRLFMHAVVACIKVLF